MSGATPPRRLPREFHEIWLALAEADRLASSRQDLARRLGVSTFTVQRILVDGDVPRFRRGQNTRVMHAWARTISRIAWSLGASPQAWVEQVGIRWDATIARVSSSAIAGHRDRGGARGWGRAETRVGQTGIARDAGALRLAVPTTVRIEGRSPIFRPVPSLGRPLVEEFSRRLLLLMDPQADLRFHRAGTREDGTNEPIPLSSPSVECGVIDPGTDTTDGELRLQIPLFRIPLAGLAWVPDGGPRFATWRTILITDARPELRFVVPRGSHAHHFIVGVCGFAPDRVTLIDGRDPQVLARALLAERAPESRARVLLVDEAMSIREARAHIEGILQAQAGDRTAANLLAVVSGEHAPAPTIPLEIALRGASASSMRGLRLLRDRELLGHGAAVTATWCAEWFTALVLDGLSPSELRVFGRGRGRGAFDRAFLLCAVETLRAAYERADLLCVSENAPPRTSPAVRAKEVVRSYLGRSLAILLDRLFPPSRVDRVSPYCRSCSASLHDRHNQGISDRFCRYCADETGRLRPREEVRALIAHWMAGWQGGLSESEALKNADFYMQALPAWREN